MNSAEWNELARSHQESKVYHLYEWGTLLKVVHGHRLVYLEEEDGVLPLALVKSFIFGNRLLSLPFADYGGPCTQDKGEADQLISRAEEIAREFKVDFLEIRAPAKDYFEVFAEHGFTRRDDYLTFILPLDKKLEELWKGIGFKKRNKVRGAEKNDVQVRLATSKPDLGKFYALYLETMKKLGSPPQSYRFFETMWNLFYPQNLILPLAIHDGEVIASGIFLTHNGTLHHAYSCSSKEHLGLAPNDLIQWQVIKWGKEQGFQQLDFGRTRENSGAYVFKRSWGGELVPMPYFYKFYKKELKERQEIRYRRLSQLWAKYMPDFAALRLGPWLIKQIG